ncbi:MAG TPA: D-alanyl-D-alanine carboxypeptidase family protein [Xanthobacteraceae bacterium]|nr:D-alanyl-D-alanine carboxypeptidase family protein [Xanthobacteraceae bacterium]
MPRFSVVLPVAARSRLRAAVVMAMIAAWAVLAAGGAAAQTGGKPEYQTSAPFAILVDADSGSVLFEKNADELMFPSSMAKLMTAEYVFNALREGRLSFDDEITISENAWRNGGAPSGGSTMYAAIHSKIRVEDLLRGVIVQSGNDACIAFAEALAGSEPAFATLLTRRARELGLTKSTFANSTGLHDPNERMTARELAKLAAHIIQTYPDLYRMYAEREFTWNKIRQQNRNPLLAMGIGADGLKTGYTKEAGYGLVGSAVQNGLRLIVVVNGLKTPKERAEEARKLLEWGFRAFESRLLFAEGETVGEAKLYGGAKGYVALTGQREIRLLVPRAGNEKITARIVYTGPIEAPVEQGTAVGKLKVWRGDRLALEAPLKTAESVGKGTLTQRAFDAATELVIGLFRAGAERI